MHGRLRSAMAGRHLQNLTPEQIQSVADAFEAFSDNGKLAVTGIHLPMKRLRCSSLAIVQLTSELGLDVGLTGHVLVERFVESVARFLPNPKSTDTIPV